MKTLDDLVRRLSSRGDVHFEATKNAVTIYPNDDDGFIIWIRDMGDEVTVNFDGWREHFTDLEKALECVGFGLSTECRLKVFSRADSEYRWEVEYRDGDDWKSDSSTTLVMFLPFWKRKTVRYLQNSIIS